jgi:hypothetical protein
MSKSGWFLLIPHSYQQSRLQSVINLLQSISANLYFPGTPFHWLTCLPMLIISRGKAQKQKRGEWSETLSLSALRWTHFAENINKTVGAQRSLKHTTRGLCITRRVNTFGIKLFAACTQRSALLRPERHCYQSSAHRVDQRNWQAKIIISL